VVVNGECFTFQNSPPGNTPYKLVHHSITVCNGHWTSQGTPHPVNLDGATPPVLVYLWFPSGVGARYGWIHHRRTSLTLALWLPPTSSSLTTKVWGGDWEDILY